MKISTKKGKATGSFDFLQRTSLQSWIAGASVERHEQEQKEDPRGRPPYYRAALLGTDSGPVVLDLDGPSGVSMLSGPLLARWR